MFNRTSVQMLRYTMIPVELETKHLYKRILKSSIIYFVFAFVEFATNFHLLDDILFISNICLAYFIFYNYDIINRLNFFV